MRAEAVSDFGVALALARGSVGTAGGLAIPLRRRGGQQIDGFALVDHADRHLAAHRWSRTAAGYARRRVDGRTVLMHREVMGMTRGDELTVDHINRDRLDNRRANLRLATQAENAQNQGSRGGSSQHRGVSLCRRSGRWVAHTSLGGTYRFLGRFDTEQEAADVAAAFRAEHMPFAID